MRLGRRRVLMAAGAMAAAAVVGPTPAGSFALRALRALAPDPVRRTLQAYVSTLVPGPGDDPEGAPGAVEAEAVEQIEAQVPYVIPLLVTDVNGAALAAHGVPFADLDYAAREALLIDAFAEPSRSALHLVALAVGAGSFYGDFRNHVGGSYIGFPGPSDGYLDTYTVRTGHGQPDGEAVPD